MEEGENVMVDHGFDNSGIAPSMSVHMPPILARQDPLTDHNWNWRKNENCSISIHMKRAIGRLKTSYRVLDRTILNMLSTNITQIAIVHGLLTKNVSSPTTC